MAAAKAVRPNQLSHINAPLKAAAPVISIVPGQHGLLSVGSVLIGSGCRMISVASEPHGCGNECSANLPARALVLQLSRGPS